MPLQGHLGDPNDWDTIQVHRLPLLLGRQRHPA